MKPVVLHLDPEGYSGEALNLLSAVAKVVPGPFTRERLEEAIVSADGLLLRLGHRIDANLIGRAPHLRFVATNTTGLDHIDLDVADARGIAVLSLRGEGNFLDTVASTAELTWGLLLSLTRRIPAALQDVRAGGWDRERFVGVDLQGRVLGLIGCGRLGRKVATYANAFGMAVHAYDPHADRWPDGVERVIGLHGLLAAADVVSVHVPLSPKTVHLIGDAEFAAMKQGALLLNTSRGPVVDSLALLRAFREGRLAGAGLDVVEGEFEPNDSRRQALIKFAGEDDRLLITPHIGGASRDAWRRTELFIVQKIVAYLKGTVR